MAKPVIGAFGSEVGPKVKKKPDQLQPLSQPGFINKPPAEHLTKAPTVHVPSALHGSVSLTGLGSKSGGSNAAVRFSAPAKYTVGGQSSGGGGGLLSDIAGAAGAIEGFMSHLSSDVVQTTLGMPMGLVYLAEHPIAGAEGIVKATWNDWSPLFHGDVRTWLHNTYEHPLAPILDVVGIVSFGAGSAARGAGAVGKLADAARGADAAAESAATVSRVAKTGGLPVFRSAAKAGADQGARGFEAVSTAGKLQRFADPAGFAARTYAKTAERLGFKGEQIDQFVQSALQNDGRARRLYRSPGGVNVYKDVSKNPLIRARQAKLAKLGNELASKSPHLARFMGDAAMYKRWSVMDKGSRRAAVARLIQTQIAQFHKAGEVITRKGERWMAEQMHPTMRDGLVAHSHAVAPAGPLGSQALTDQIKQLADEGFQPIMADHHSAPLMQKALTTLGKKGKAGLSDYFNQHWSEANITNDANKVLLDANGQMRVVSRTADKIGKEAFWSSSAVKLLYTKPTKVWKYLLLGASPRYFINNFVGNSMMLMAATDPVSLTRAFISHVRIVRGAKAADRMAEDTLRRTLPQAQAEEAIAARRAQRAIKGRHWMEQWFGQEYGFGQSNRIDPKTGLPVEGIEAKAQRFTLNKVTHERADMPMRYMAMNYTMKRLPEFQQQYARLRAGGMGHFAAEQRAAAKVAENPAARQLIRMQVNHMFGQYHTFAGWEQNLQRVVPFYSWDRAIVTHAHNLFKAEPYKLAMGAAIGTLGNVKTQDILGQVPDFMLGAIPAKVMSGPLGWLGKSHGGRQLILNTYGVNPYATLGDISQTAMAALPGDHSGRRVGESFGAQLNPMIQSAAQEIAGVNLQTGTPVQPNSLGPIAGMYADTFSSLPQWQILEGLLGHEGSSVTKKGNPTLYEKNFESKMSSWLGVPLRRFDPSTAAAMAQLQGGKKKPSYRIPTSIPGF